MFLHQIIYLCNVFTPQSYHRWQRFRTPLDVLLLSHKWQTDCEQMFHEYRTHSLVETTEGFGPLEMNHHLWWLISSFCWFTMAGDRHWHACTGLSRVCLHLLMHRKPNKSDHKMVSYHVGSIYIGPTVGWCLQRKQYQYSHCNHIKQTNNCRQKYVPKSTSC